MADLPAHDCEADDPAGHQGQHHDGSSDHGVAEFFVRFLCVRVTRLLGADEIAPASEVDAHLWLRRQLDALASR